MQHLKNLAHGLWIHVHLEAEGVESGSAVEPVEEFITDEMIADELGRLDDDGNLPSEEAAPEAETPPEADAEQADPASDEREASFDEAAQEEKTTKAISRLESQLADSQARNDELMQAVRQLQQLAQQPQQQPEAKAQPDLEALRDRVQFDPAGVLEELGYDLTEHGDLAAQQAFARSKAGAANPKAREQATRNLQLREAMQRATRAEKAASEAAQRFEEYQQRQANQAAVERYMNRVVQAVNDQAPLVKDLLATDPDEAMALLGEVAHELANGKAPPYAEVITELEKREAARDEQRISLLKRRGYTVTKVTPAVGDTAATKTPTPAQASQTPTATKTASNTNQLPQDDEEELDHDELMEKIAREIEGLS